MSYHLNKATRGGLPLALAAAILLITPPPPLTAQPFAGTNQPGAGSSYGFTVSAGVTNLSLVISNTASVFSHLYLKLGTGASASNYDYAARLNTATNSLNLELPELVAATNYSLWVQTPTNSAAHAFAVTLTTNRPDARLATMPVTKRIEFSVTGVLAAGQTHYFRFDVPTNLPGWRIVLTGSPANPDPDLYIQRGALPTLPSYLKRSLGRPVDTLFLDSPEATNATYFVSVLIPGTDSGSATYTLSAEIAPVVTLVWEPGTTATPATVYTNRSLLGGDYFFKITTQSADSGVWRTRLDVQSGEADLWLLKTSSLLTPVTRFDYGSTNTGSDGLALVQPDQNQSGQQWYAMVTANPGDQWSIYSGNLFVTPLPAPSTDNHGGTNTSIAPEGMNFYRTTIGSSTLAWRLGLGGLTNNLYVRQTNAAHSYSITYYDWKQAGQTLLVPPYLKSETNFFVTVSGTPGQPFTLDSREQPIIEFPFDSGTNVVATDYGYVTYHVAVPPNQIGWQLDLLADSGDPAIAVRQSAVASEHFSTAYSHRTNAPFETLTLVPPTLTDGSYYLTVYGTPPFTATLTNSRPVVTDVAYAFVVTNDLPTLQGWRFYRITDVQQQLNSLGWELLLSRQLPGTEIALRRSYLPGRWSSRTNYNKTTYTSATNYLNVSSLQGFLQVPRHVADIWYIGINHTNQPLGSFVLTGEEPPRPMVALTTNFTTTYASEHKAGMFRYFQVEVPTNALGMEFTVENLGAGDPRMVVCRGMLPVDMRTILINGSAWNPLPNNATTWPIGAQIAYTTDWTGFTTDANGDSEQGRFFFAGRGNPLEPGTYYIGVTSGPGNTNDMDYGLLARGFFAEGSFTDVPFIGSSSRAGVWPHESCWYRVVVPTNTPSWKLRLNMDSGDGLLVLRPEGLPNYGAAPTTLTGLGGCELQKLGNEHFVLLAKSPQTNVPVGTYYLGVVGQGEGSSGTQAGSNTCSFTLTSEGSLNFLALGTVDRLGVTHLLSTQSQEGGETRGFRFTVPTNTLVIEARLRDRTNNPQMVLRGDAQAASLPDPYGYSGGWAATWADDQVIRIVAPTAGVYTLLIQAAATGGVYSNATYTLDVSAQRGELLAFDNGVFSVTNQYVDGWRYFAVTVPPEALGWDLRLTNVTAGDPKMVICRDAIPFDLTTRTASGTAWSPFTATNWPAGFQFAPDKDWTGYTLSASGTNETGRIFTGAMGNPLEPGTYIVGITSGGTPGSAKGLSYDLVSRGISTNLAIPVLPIEFAGGLAYGARLAPHDAAFYRVEVPTNMPSWQLRLAVTNGEALLVLRKDGLPNFGAAVATSVTNLAGCKLQKTGDEHFALLPAQPGLEIPRGTYYLGVVSEGAFPQATRIGSNSCGYVVQSVGTLPVTPLGEVNPYISDIVTTASQPGGSVTAYKFNVAPGTLGIGVQLLNRVGNPSMTLKSGDVFPQSLDSYGRQGGWIQDWAGTTNITVSSIASNRYSLLIHASAVSGLYSNASYTLWIFPLVRPTNSISFDGGRKSVIGHAAGYWTYFFTEVPTNALGWDLRLTDILSGSPRLVVCRAAFPSDLTSRLPDGAAWNWGAATNWPVGAQAAPGLDWTGWRYEPNLVDTTGTILAVGMNSSLEPGQYIIGISSAPGTNTPMSYTLASRGVGTNFMIPVRPLGTGDFSTNFIGLLPREAAYYSLNVPTNTPLWKLHLATAGEGLLVVRKGALPNVTASTNALASGIAGGHKFQRPGDEHALLGQTATETNVPAGTYYLAVVGEGQSPSLATNMIGAGNTDFTLFSRLPAPLTALGSLSGGTDDLLVTNTLGGGESAIYEFNFDGGAASLTVSLENLTGNSLLRLRNDQKMPLDLSAYGQDGGYRGIWESTNRVAINNPTSGVYRVSVLATSGQTNWPPLQYTMRIHAQLPLSAIPLAFDGGSAVIPNHGDLWQVFSVSVPSNAVGWDLRLASVTAGAPRLVIRRDLQPTSLASSNVSFTSTTWPSGAQLAPTNDWTGLDEADGRSVTGRVFQVGMGNPLAPGVYYVGVTNLTPAIPATYTLISRGIGAGMSVPVNDLGFLGGGANLSLGAREAAWYKVTVPTNTPSWRVALWFDAGDGLLLAQRDYLPSIGAAAGNGLSPNTGGKKMRITGDEYLLALSASGSAYLTPGIYYLGVVSEGLNPSNILSRIGTGNATCTLWSGGASPPVELGSIGSQDLVGQGLLGGGECVTWSFGVPAGILAAQALLEQTTGSPVMTLAPGSYPPAAAQQQQYGAEGGTTAKWQSARTITIPNPGETNYSITVQATGSGLAFADAGFTLRVRSLPIASLNFAPELNTNGLSNTAAGELLDGDRVYLRVQIPDILAGRPVIGWKLSLEALYGTPAMRVRRDALPDKVNDPGVSTNFLRQAVFVPDYLTPGTWYIEIAATGLSHYQITSESVELARPAWPMPAFGQPVTTPGLPAAGPLFGDTGIGTNGVALPDPGGTDLEQDSFHYYAVTVPPGNGGLLRTELVVISGNPNLYLRTNAPPTLSHNATGAGGPLYNRSLTSAIGTEYGDWAVLNGKTELDLTPGTWYLAVHAAGGSHARYRLKVSTGNISDLAFAGGSRAGQTLAAGDWRYYRVLLPVDMPDRWTISFTEQQGDVSIYLRDTLPPGLGLSTNTYVDWSSDAKNHGPYPYFTNAGAYTLSVPPVRPGNVYYLGVRAVSDASFTLSSIPGVNPLGLAGVIAFKGGFVTNQIPSGGVLRYRIDAPECARRWRHSATHASSVFCYIDQGTLPTMTSVDHWSSSGPNSSYSAVLSYSSWPWWPGQMYYLTVINISASPQPFSFRMDGEFDDLDADGLPDCWEIEYFGSIYAYGPNDDPDADGFTNMQEYLAGTDPTAPNSVALAAPFKSTDGKLGFYVIGPANRTYRVQASTNLAPGSWVDRTNYLQTTPAQLIQVPIAPDQPRQFYRAVSP